jgi:ElaB/YqjD/DUF883 family membrane-anchored ribosome-binding protein
MIINRFNRFLRVEATGQSDYAGESLSDRMAGQEFTFTPPGQAPPAPDPTPTPSPAQPDPVVVKPAEATLLDPADDTDDDLDELPAFGTKTTAAPKSADLDFDAQTDAIVAAITAKGHPGDEYKRLRAELKALKEKKPIEDLDSIPEIQTLRQQAAEAERLKGEAEALRQRNKELLQANNEVEVKESDEFIAQVKQPISNIEKMVGQIAQTAEISPADIFSVITEQDIIKQDRMLEQLHQKLGSRTAGRIERFCDDYKAAVSKGEEMLASSGQNAERARLARENASKQQAEQKVELFKASVEASFTQYAKNIPGYTDSSGNLTDIAHAAMHSASVVDINSLGPDDIGYLAFAANALPETRKAIAALRKENAILKGTRKTPAPISGQPAPAPTGDDEFMGLSERMKGMDFTFTPPS